MSNRLKVILVAAGVAVVGVVIAIAIHFGGGETTDHNSVKIEIRSRPPATVRMNGAKVGKTPLSLTVPRGTTPIELDARYDKKKHVGKDVEVVEQVEVQKVVPDQDRVVDFLHLKPAE